MLTRLVINSTHPGATERSLPADLLAWLLHFTNSCVIPRHEGIKKRTGLTPPAIYLTFRGGIPASNAIYLT